MGIKMNTYAGGQITAGNDAILHDRAIANTGILHGCNITFMGANQIHIISILAPARGATHIRR